MSWPSVPSPDTAGRWLMHAVAGPEVRRLAHWLVRSDPTPQFVWVTGALLLMAPVAVGLLLRSGDAGRRAEAEARRAETLAHIAVALTTPRAGVLAVEVVNPLVPGRGAICGGGYGLVGLRERAAAVGGRLEAGPTPGDRWCLRVELPHS